MAVDQIWVIIPPQDVLGWMMMWQWGGLATGGQSRTLITEVWEEWPASDRLARYGCVGSGGMLHVASKGEEEGRQMDEY